MVVKLDVLDVVVRVVGAVEAALDLAAHNQMLLTEMMVSMEGPGNAEPLAILAEMERSG